MTKIGLLNFHYSDHNYGAVLQAAALQRAVINLGFKETENINFIPPTPKKTLKNKVGDLLRALGLKAKHERAQVSHNGEFEKFRQEYIKTSNVYHSSQELSKSNYSAIIVGSDQVFRPAMTQANASSYFLDFVSDNATTKIAYAASFGVDKWEASNPYAANITHFKTLLQDFSAISVREDSGVDICKKTFNVTATQVLDPTLLIGESFFHDMIKQNIDDYSTYKGKLVYYKLDCDQTFFNCLDRLTDETGLLQENIYYGVDNTNRQSYLPVKAWLSAIYNSDLVVTDSFHCVCLSILFRKEFICVANPDRGIARLSSLLEPLGLENRLYDSSDNVDYKKLTKIEWDKVENELEKKRIHSFSFLKTSLGL